jgi:hypothetical protein
MNLSQKQVLKVLSTINLEEGITIHDLGIKLHNKYSDTLIFTNFKDFINFQILFGRLKEINEKIFITEKGNKWLEANNK